MRALLALLLLLPAAGAARAAAPANITVSMIEPRSFGYFVGDVFRREALIDVPDPYRLEPASLPAPGRLTYWLDLRAVTVAHQAISGGRRYRVSLDYQNFYVPLQPTRLVVPGATLSFSGGKESVEAEIPAWPFVAAAMREIAPEKPASGPAGYLQPDTVPGFVAIRWQRTVFTAAVAALVLSLALLAHHMAWWPFRARPSRPFTSAARAIRSRFAASHDAEAYRASLLDLHRAFDAAAGRRILAEDVPDFVESHRDYAPFGGDIARFFAASRRAFFGNDLEGAAHAMPAQDVAALGAELGAAERKAA